MFKILLLLCCFNILFNTGKGQTIFETAKEPKVRLDLNGAGFVDALPFDVPFKIFGLAHDADLVSINFFIKEGKHTSMLNARKFADWKSNINQKIPFMVICDESLKPNEDYTFRFQVERKLTAEEQTLLRTLIIEKLKAFLDLRLIFSLNFELTRRDIAGVAKDVIDILSVKLAQADLTVNKGGLQFNYYDMIRTALSDLTSLSENLYKLPLEEFIDNSNVTYLRNTINTLRIVIPGEAGFVSTGEYIDLVDQIAALKEVTNHVSSRARLAPGTLTAIIDASERALEDMRSLAGNGTATYKNIEDELREYLNRTKGNFIAYRDAPATIKPELDKAAETLGSILAKVIYSDIIVTGSTYGTYEARANFYLSMDIGVAVFPTINKGAPYLGTNIYLRPVNKQRPIYKGKYNPFRCFSFLVGISIGSLSTANKREDLFANSMNFLAGAGYRVTDHIRLNGGFVFYKGMQQNPLLNSSGLGVNGFVSLSFDWDIGSVFKTIFTPSIPGK